MLDKVKDALAAIAGEGQFAIELVCGPEDLSIEVEGVGPIRFPIPVATVRKLSAVARPAPFGRRDKTLYDKSVRDTWEIDGRLVKIDTRRWMRSLEPRLELIRQRLGLPEGGKLEARLDKMLVYEPGQFFAPHQDSERDDDMIGTLIVELPSAHTGGSVVVQHGEEKKVFRGAAKGTKDLSLLAFYADCHHEVKPVKFGYRVSLVYHLLFRGAVGDAPQLDPAAVDRLAASVEQYFSTPVQREYSKDPPQRPDRLIYLLDHEYTERSLGWGHLKNADRLRAAALRDVAEILDAEVFLALAEVHEIWDCEVEERGGRYGWGRYRYEYEEEQDEDGLADEEGHRLLDRIDSDIELRHWIGPDGRVVAGIAAHPREKEVCFTRASSELNPFRSEYEGYQGNYGNTVDRWYHRAAVVMWPRARDFVIRAKVSPSSAVKELASRIKAGALEEARAGARELLPFWRGVASQETSAAFTVALLKLAALIDDAELAHELTAPLGPDRLTGLAIPAFVRLVERYGAAWAQQVLSTWNERERYSSPPWLSSLPGLCEALGAAGEQGAAVSEWLLSREAASFKKRLEGALQMPELLTQGLIERDLDDLLALLEAAAVIPAPAIRDDLVAFLMAPETRLPLMLAGALLERAREGRTPAAVRALGLEALYHKVVERLEATVAAPARSPDDWSIQPTYRCACALCKELSAFLRDPHRTLYAWPLAKDGRHHIHQKLDTHRLPVTHTTRRAGRPYTLVLTKQRALFELDAELRARQSKLLTWLKKQRGAFSARAAAATR